MSRSILKTLIFALCLTLGMRSALPVSALEIQYDYCRDFTDNQKAICQSILFELKQISRENLLEANKLAVTAVEQQIPNFNALKEVPYAQDLVEMGSPCGLQTMPDANPWNIFCGPWSAKWYLAVKLANIADGTDPEVISQDPTFQAIIDKTFKDLIDLGKSDARYADDENFRTGVDAAEQNYDAGMTLLRQAVLYFNKSASVDSMTSTELITALQALPEYQTYHLKAPSSDASDVGKTAYSTGLYSTYAIAKRSALYDQEVPQDIDYGDYGVYNGVVNSYVYLVTAATAVDANFKVDLSSLLSASTAPSAPDTGTNQDGETSATIVTVAIAGIASIAAASGAILVAKGYLFSPLKRRK